MGLRTRIRDLDGLKSYVAKLERYDRNHTTHLPVNGTYISTLVGPVTYTPASTQRSWQKTADENHKLRNPHDLRESQGDLGGPFDSVKSGVRCDMDMQILSASGWTYDSGATEYQIRKTCPVLACNPATLSPMTTGPNFRRNLKPVGTTAIARCKPTNHISDLAIDMVEIYQTGLPHLPGRRLWEDKVRRYAGVPADRLYFNPGSEYLNIEFGWKPLTDDIRDASYAAANADRLMSAYEANSGKDVRRSYVFPTETSLTSNDQGVTEGFTIVDPGQQYGTIDGALSQPRLVKTTKFIRETWFRGCFTYHLPSIYKSRNRLARIAAEAGHLYGIELTPNTVWQATPWTWALDWFTNMGDVVSNLSDWATDGLVMRYGYLMEHIVYEESYALDRPCRLKLWGGGHAHASPVTAYYESKQRIRATPFGFEADWNNLSLRQLAIAFALGISRWF